MEGSTVFTNNLQTDLIIAASVILSCIFNTLVYFPLARQKKYTVDLNKKSQPLHYHILLYYTLKEFEIIWKKLTTWRLFISSNRLKSAIKSPTTLLDMKLKCSHFFCTHARNHFKWFTALVYKLYEVFALILQYHFYDAVNKKTLRDIAQVLIEIPSVTFPTNSITFLY